MDAEGRRDWQHGQEQTGEQDEKRQRHELSVLKTEDAKVPREGSNRQGDNSGI